MRVALRVFSHPMLVAFVLFAPCPVWLASHESGACYWAQIHREILLD